MNKFLRGRFSGNIYMKIDSPKNWYDVIVLHRGPNGVSRPGAMKCTVDLNNYAPFTGTLTLKNSEEAW